MNRTFVTATLVTATLLAGGCNRQPALDVQEAPESAAAPAPAGMAPAHDSAAATADPLPAGHPPIDPAAPGMAGFEIAPVDPSLGQGAAGMAWTAPADWVSEPPANSMRRAQYRVPGPGGDGECVVFYFGPGQGGDPMANAERWASQFLPAGGGDPVAAMKSSTIDVGGIPVLLVETAGTFQAGSMMGGPVTEKPGYSLLGAVAQGPDANWFFKFTGPTATVEAQRAAFDALLRSLRTGG